MHGDPEPTREYCDLVNAGRREARELIESLMRRGFRRGGAEALVMFALAESVVEHAREAGAPLRETPKTSELTDAADAAIDVLRDEIMAIRTSQVAGTN